MSVGTNVTRVDAYEKVTGRAKFTDDYILDRCLVAKVCHSTIANGRVVHIDTSKAEQVPGVVKVVTFKDVPDVAFPTPGHPWSCLLYTSGFPILNIKQLMDMGICISLGCDGSATNDSSNLLDTLRMAYLMQAWHTKARGGCVTAYDLLKAATINGAKTRCV